MKKREELEKEKEALEKDFVLIPNDEPQVITYPTIEIPKPEPVYTGPYAKQIKKIQRNGIQRQRQN